MSIDIVRIDENTVIARTVCDDCKDVLDERPARMHERPGTRLLVCDWCKECAPRHSFLLDVPWHVEQGPTYANLDAIARVRIRLSDDKPKEDK